MRVDHLMYAKDFKLLVARLGSLKKSNVDSGIAEFLTMVNLSPELVTIFSTEGVPSKPGFGTGRVVFGVRDRKHIEKLFELVASEFGERRNFVKLNMVYRTNPAQLRDPKTGRLNMCAMWDLQWGYRADSVTQHMGCCYLQQAGIKFLHWLKEQGN